MTDYQVSSLLNLVNTSTNSTVLPDGGTLVRFNQTTVAVDDPPTTPWHLNPVDCYGFVVISADGKTSQGAGGCDGVDKDGDRWAVSWTVVVDQDRWTVVHGTGKFAGMTGEGISESLYVDDRHQVLKSTGVLRLKDR